uniref:Thioredoxin domain-containing protein n=1 Tax=Rhabditophanes sp. KR3021 TaxID=114890 RepID=A0AC35UCF9_9BILA
MANQYRLASTLNELVTTSNLINKDKSPVKAEDALKNKVKAIYFSASWCTSCQKFTPKLKRFYEAVNKDNKELEVVWVSLDRTEEDQVEYFKKMGPWVCMEYNKYDAVMLQKELGIKTIPYLIVVKDDGTVVVDDGRMKIDSEGIDHPTELFKKWKALSE